MEGIEPILAWERRRKRAFALRAKQVVASVSTLSYGGLAGAAVEPILKHEAFAIAHAFIGCASLAGLAACVVIAPWAEVEHERL